MSDPTGAFLYQINISNGGVPKHSIDEAHISVNGVSGDKQNNQTLHGGPDRAVCLFSSDLIESLRQEGHPIQAGSSGENLTISGLDWSKLKLGDQLKIGETLSIELMSYAEPCRHNAQWFKDKNYKRISEKIHPGWSRIYAKVLQEGIVRTGDSVYIEETVLMEPEV